MKKWLLVSLLGLTGCSMFTTSTPFPLKETSPENVRECRKVGKFYGPSGFRMWGPPATLGAFKLEAAKKAKAMGATHIYWREDLEGVEGGIVGYAFDCTGVEVDMDENDFEEYR
ncbi:MAG TPA: hypothetical protein PLI53_03345 [Geobacteraceae bacterium]|nr:hypothetical protein [Geobacteraceae bacterium]